MVLVFDSHGYLETPLCHDLPSKAYVARGMGLPGLCVFSTHSMTSSLTPLLVGKSAGSHIIGPIPCGFLAHSSLQLSVFQLPSTYSSWRDLLERPLA